MMRFRPQGFLPNRQREAELSVVGLAEAETEMAEAGAEAEAEPSAPLGVDNLRAAPPGQDETGPDARGAETPDEGRDSVTTDMTRTPPPPDNLLTGALDDASILVRSRGVTKKFGGLTAVNNVDFDIPRGSIVSLIGPNGAGKTTFFNMITGYYTPTAGEISFDGQAITTEAGGKVRSKKPHEVTAMGIGRTFQNIRLFGAMSVLDNVRVGLNVHLKSHWWDSVLRTPGMLREEQAAIAEAMGLLELVDLRPRAETWARNLPYGDQRRLEIARALATRPKFTLLDEPTAGMNSQRDAAR